MLKGVRNVDSQSALLDSKMRNSVVKYSKLLWYKGE